MKLRPTILSITFLILAFVVFPGTCVLAQNVVATSEMLPRDFLDLADLRGSLNTEISTLEREIIVLKDSLRSAETWARTGLGSEHLARRDSAQLSAIQNRTPEQDQKLGYALRYLQDAADAKVAPARLRDLIASKEKELVAKQDLARQVRARISSLLDPEQRFKRTMSMTFAVLIGLVIAGFFVLAMRDAAIREKVFGGQAGIQFLTLFSLVIAIILFGITGILEGKELSALLGGLSGYILGRSSDGRISSSGERVVNEPA